MYKLTAPLLLTLAADLASEDGENIEYDRALVELVTEAFGLSHSEDGDTVRRMILRRRAS